MALLVLVGVAEPELGTQLCCMAIPGWHAPLVLGSSWSLFVSWQWKRAIFHLMQVASTIETPLNSTALAGIVPGFLQALETTTWRVPGAAGYQSSGGSEIFFHSLLCGR